MNAVQRWAALTPGDRIRLPLLMLSLPLVSAALRYVGYKRTRAVVERLSRHPHLRAANAADIQHAQRLAELAAIAGRRGLVEATCLPQTLVVYASLRRRGLRPQLRIGVTRNPALPLAHAWVELEGQALGSGAAGHIAYADGD